LKFIQNSKLSLVISIIFFLSSCSSTGTSSYNSGYKSGYSKSESLKYYPPVALDVLIPVFNGGIEKLNDEDLKNFSDIRRAESIHFAVKLKNKIKDRKVFANPKVMPSARAFSDIYVFGEIIKSNGRDLELKIFFEDAQGKEIKVRKNKLTKTYKGNGKYKLKCNEKCRNNYKSNPRLRGKSPFDAIFTDIAKNLEIAVSKRSAKNLYHIQKTKELRFARFISPEKFSNYLETKKGRKNRLTHKLIYEPDTADPMFIRSNAVRLRESVFVDESQQYIEDHVDNQKFLTQYNNWLDQNASALEAKEKADSAQTAAVIGGILSIAVAAYGASEGNSDLAAGGAVSSAVLFNQAKKYGAEAKMYADAIEELNIDINSTAASRNIEIENLVFEARGSIENQFEEFSNFLRRVYYQETLPIDNTNNY
tara:strand:- start:1992 stop:3257 length:1266 start_codon:yes stop_codon:yes gene_type:complete